MDALKPFAWAVKDFADGWIFYTDEVRARREADTMGSPEIGALYLHPPGSAPAPSAPVEAVAKERPDRTQELLENASICIRAAMKADNLSDARAMMQAALDFTTNDTEALAEGATYATFQEVGR